MSDTKDFVDPVPGTRLSRKNILALVLTITGVLLVLFFSSRRSPSPQPLEPVPDYEALPPITIGTPDLEIPPRTTWQEGPPPARPAVRDERQRARFDEARRARPLVHTSGAQLSQEAPRETAKPPSQHVIRAATLIEAALESELNSKRPGPVLARVVKPVRSEHHTLIPVGTRLIGTMVAGSGESVVVAWTSMEFPEGRTQALPSWQALDLVGTTGLRDEVNHHRLRTYGGAALMTLLGSSATMASPYSGLGGTLLALELSRNATGTLQHGLRRSPTITVRPGYRFLIYVSEDLPLEAPNP